MALTSNSFVKNIGKAILRIFFNIWKAKLPKAIKSLHKTSVLSAKGRSKSNVQKTQKEKNILKSYKKMLLKEILNSLKQMKR